MRRELLELGYQNGVRTVITVAAEGLRLNGGMGFPEEVLEALKVENKALMVLKFDFDNPQVHGGMEVEFFDELVEMSLSFNTLYRVQIPYSLIGQVVFPFTIESWSPPKEEQGSGLRLV